MRCTKPASEQVPSTPRCASKAKGERKRFLILKSRRLNTILTRVLDTTAADFLVDTTLNQQNGYWLIGDAGQPQRVV
eukprot:m.86221 g.86221  ORF g.86221 m.86221 type:complete len:77 (-) comp50913_c0_seq1:680-910(-)